MAAPGRVQPADDALSADSAYRLACAGTGLLWQGDFQNARQLLQALARRADRPRRARRKGAATSAVATGPQAFHQYRQAQAQRAHTLSMLLIPVAADRRIALRRAPDLGAALRQAWGEDEREGNGADALARVVPLRELLGIIGAYEWRRNGIEIAALGEAPMNRIHPHYGVYSPVRGEYLDLVAAQPLPAAARLAFDIGCGTGVIAALLARRGVADIVATDHDPRAIACTRDNVERLGLAGRVETVRCDLFPPGRAGLVVCNPPWLPGRAAVPIEAAIYDEDSRMLRRFLAGLAAHLVPGGEGWLILSDLAEHLRLRSRAQLLDWIEAAGLLVLDQRSVRAAPRQGRRCSRSAACGAVAGADHVVAPRRAARRRRPVGLGRLKVLLFQRGSSGTDARGSTGGATLASLATRTQSSMCCSPSNRIAE